MCNAIRAHAQTAFTEFLGHRQVQGLNTEYERLRKENEGASTGKGKAGGTSEGSTSLQSLRKEIQSLQVVPVQHLSRSKLPAYTALSTLFAFANISGALLRIRAMLQVWVVKNVLTQSHLLKVQQGLSGASI